jgi:hypothetical protein
MKLYLISQDLIDGYETFSAAVVVAESVSEARNMHPRDGKPLNSAREKQPTIEWVSDSKDVKVKYLGEASPKLKRGVVMSEYLMG